MSSRELLSDLNKAKAVFQLRAIVAAMGIKPDETITSFSDTCEKLKQERLGE